MSRIRTIKPEFWTDDLLGALTREQRLLFIASWNLADDEGLLRWTAPYLKGAVFPFDDDLSVADVEEDMAALVKTGIVYFYRGGRSQQSLAYIVNFHKHQRINRPSPSRLPPPSIQSIDARRMYAERDGWKCHLCDGQVDEAGNETGDDYAISLDHIVPVSAGGKDFPSNIKAAHQTCNKGRGDRGIEEYRTLLRSGKTNAQRRNPDRFTHLNSNASVSDSLNDSSPELELEGEKEEKKDIRAVGKPTRSAIDDAFDEFWKVYPKRGGANPKSPAFKVFKTFVASGVDPPSIIDGARRCAEKERAKIGTEFIPQAVKWLRDRRWQDYNADPEPYPTGAENGGTAWKNGRQPSAITAALDKHLERFERQARDDDEIREDAPRLLSNG